MKKGIHPDYPVLAVRLADGTTFQTRSTMGVERYNTEVDSSNHPFYTGKKTVVDTAGRIDKFNRRYAGGKKADAPAADAPAADAPGETEG
jgi:large subunit ribosomal protein L31